ncbi:MAG TPA: FG-GAP repeat protein [Flavobacteriaceae bacterium]|nr:FG-GAP repeat protein [Flavobacteriaceae bacterium]
MTNTIAYSLVFFFLLLISCNKNDKQAQNNPFLEIAVIKELEQYYHQKYKEGNRVVREESEGIITIDYFKNAYNENNYESFVLRIEIPKEKESEYILTGDLNNDNTADLIVGVFTEGGGYGGKIYWIDYFVFLKKENNYHLTTVKSNRELSECEAGFVYFNKIEKNIIKTTESCFVERDSRCCPSLHYYVVLEVVDEGVVVKSKEVVD